MAKKRKPTSGSQWVNKNETKSNKYYNLLNLLSERPDGILLTPQEASLISLLNQSPISTFKAREAGIMNPSTRVGDLRNKGAVIDLIYQDLVEQGYVHRGVAIYKLAGWIPEGTK